jgi:hypothetical protein
MGIYSFSFFSPLGSTAGFMIARQALCHFSHVPIPLSFFFKIHFSQAFILSIPMKPFSHGHLLIFSLPNPVINEPVDSSSLLRCFFKN